MAEARVTNAFVVVSLLMLATAGLALAAVLRRLR
jgi:hypothetical protein